MAEPQAGHQETPLVTARRSWWQADGWMVGILGLLLAGVLLPLLQERLISNDDLRLANDMQSGGLKQAATSLWEISISQGRPHIGKMSSYPLPYLINATWYFKTVTFTLIGLNVLLFGLLAGKFARSHHMGIAAAAIWMMIICHSNENSPLSFNPGIYTTASIYLFGGLWLGMVRRDRWWPDVLAAFLLLLTYLTYELYLCFAALPWIIHLGRDGWKEGFRRWRQGPWWQTAAFVLALLVYVGFRRAGAYAGTTVNLSGGVGSIFQTTVGFASFGLPGGPLANKAYRSLLVASDQYCTNWRQLVPMWIVKAIGGAIVIACCIRRDRSERFSWHGLVMTALVAVAYLVLPVFPYALSPMYRECYATGAYVGVIGSYYSTFAAAVLLLVVLIGLGRVRWVWPRRAAIAATLAGLAIVSVSYDRLSWTIGSLNAHAYARVPLMQNLVASPAWAAIPEHSVIYAPTLIKSEWGLGFTGRPSLSEGPLAARLFAGIGDWWTWKVIQFGSKPMVLVYDRMQMVEATPHTVYLLEYRPGGFAGDAANHLLLSRCQADPDGTLHAASTTVIGDGSQYEDLVVAVHLEQDPPADSVGNLTMGEVHNRLLITQRSLPGGYQVCSVGNGAPTYDPESISVLSGIFRPQPLALAKVGRWLSGHYDDTWTAPLATLGLPPSSQPSRLRVMVIYPPGDSPRPAQQVQLIGADGQPLATCTLAPSNTPQWLEAGIPAGKASTVQVKSSQFHRPCDESSSGDQRQLSVLIPKVEWVPAVENDGIK